MDATLRNELEIVAKSSNLSATEFASAMELLKKAEESATYTLELQATSGFGRRDPVIRAGLAGLEIEREAARKASEPETEETEEVEFHAMGLSPRDLEQLEQALRQGGRGDSGE